MLFWGWLAALSIALTDIYGCESDVLHTCFFGYIFVHICADLTNFWRCDILFIKEKPPHSQLAVRGLCCSG